MIKKILVFLVVVCLLLMTILIGWLGYEYNHPYLCEYYYIKGNKKGKSHQCSGKGNDKYCRKDVTTVISVDDWEYKCGRE